jgi:E3 ubiquitin-protein ligase RNF5
MQSIERTCPVCKAGVDRDKVIPVYGPGGNGDPRNMDGGFDEVPPRPLGQRPLPVVFGRRGGAPGSHVAYMPNVGMFRGGYREVLSPEQQHQAFLSRLLLLLGSVVIMCLLFM